MSEADKFGGMVAGVGFDGYFVGLSGGGGALELEEVTVGWFVGDGANGRFLGEMQIVACRQLAKSLTG